VGIKPLPDEGRAAPALDIAQLLVELGAKVQAYDPKAMETARPLLPKEILLCDSAIAALEGTQAVILVTEWEEFIGLPWEEVAKLMSKPRFIFDGRNALDGRALTDLGFKYQGVGRNGPKWSSES